MSPLCSQEPMELCPKILRVLFFFFKVSFPGKKKTKQERELYIFKFETLQFDFENVSGAYF